MAPGEGIRVVAGAPNPAWYYVGMKLSLSPEIERLIEERIRSGMYRTPEDVIAAAVSNLHQQEMFGDFEPGELDELLAEGERSGEALDGEQVFAELRELWGRKQG
jgi:antitoxin ParD1/3/4